MMRTKTFVFNDFSENTYVLYDETLDCVIIDPGCYHSHEQKQLAFFIKEQGLNPVKLLNTHCHIDHILGNRFVMDEYKLSLHLHEKELFTYNDAKRWLAMLNMKPSEDFIPQNIVFIDEKQTIAFGNSELKIAFTPGHSIASVTFYSPDEKLAIVGDVLFAQSIGRTDLPGGDYDTLINSIKSQLMIWPDDMKIYPGHGPATTIGEERAHNPFLR